MKISVAMATYNGAKYLQDQLDSFIRQKRPPDELVITDDQSKDETLQILQNFRLKAPFEVKIYENADHLGYAQNFNRALKNCTGDLIFLSDQDDVWYKTKISTIKEIYHQNKSFFVFMNNADIVFEDLTPTGFTKLDQIKSAGFTAKSFVMGACAAIRSDYLRLMLPIPSHSSHDNWIIGFAAELHKRKILAKSLQLYRRHNFNTSNAIFNSTKKISKLYQWKRRIDFVNKPVKPNINQNLHKLLSQQTFFIKQARKLLTQTKDNELIHQLYGYINTANWLQSNIIMRTKIRQMSALSRTYDGVILLLKGGYRQFEGTASFIRDVISPEKVV